MMLPGRVLEPWQWLQLCEKSPSPHLFCLAFLVVPQRREGTGGLTHRADWCVSGRNIAGDSALTQALSLAGDVIWHSFRLNRNGRTRVPLKFGLGLNCLSFRFSSMPV